VAGEDEHGRVFGWRYDATLSLAAKPRMNITAAVIYLSNYKVRCHSMIACQNEHQQSLGVFA
jgi:hypothetical protein